MSDVYTHERDGKAVTFVDAYGKSHDALVTVDWSTKTFDPGAVNLVYVTDDKDKSDPYGLQIERQTSVPHKSSQSAAGVFWE